MSEDPEPSDEPAENPRAKVPHKSRYDFPRSKRGRDRFVFTIRKQTPGRPRRLDKYLQERFEGYSRTFLQSLIKQGRVLVNGETTRSAREIAVGDEITLLLPEGLVNEPEHIAFDVLYEDKHILALNKPPGVVVHPARGHLTGTLYNGLLHYFRERIEDDPSFHIGTVHRLDEETSGVMVYALGYKSNAELTRQFENRLVHKTYVAIAAGEPSWAETEVDAPLGVDPECKYRVAVDGVDARSAQTAFRRVSASKGFSLIVAHPHTGRSHQIRVHLKHLGLPLAGDDLYGGPRRHEAWDAWFPEGLRVCLHAQRLQLQHPIEGHEMVLRAPLPEDMARVCEALGLDTGGL